MLAVNVILKNQVQKTTFIVINKSIVVKLKEPLLNLLLLILSQVDFVSTWGRFYNFIKLKTMKAVIVNMDQKEPGKATQSL